jgi:FG-GAP-like repeat
VCCLSVDLDLSLFLSLYQLPLPLLTTSSSEPTCDLPLCYKNNDGTPDCVMFQTAVGFATGNISPLFPDARGHIVYYPGIPPSLLSTSPQLPTFSAEAMVNVSTTAFNVDVLVLDINQDGYPDILAGSSATYGIQTYYQGSVSLYVNNGNGSFTEQHVASVQERIYSITSFDMNNDGFFDIFIGGHSSVFLVHGTAPGQFNKTLPLPTLSSLPIATFNKFLPADLDGDGYLDLLVQISLGRPTFCRNSNGYLNCTDGAQPLTANSFGWWQAVDFDGGMSVNVFF